MGNLNQNERTFVIMVLIFALFSHSRTMEHKNSSSWNNWIGGREWEANETYEEVTLGFDMISTLNHTNSTVHVSDTSIEGRFWGLKEWFVANVWDIFGMENVLKDFLATRGTLIATICIFYILVIVAGLLLVKQFIVLIVKCFS